MRASGLSAYLAVIPWILQRALLGASGSRLALRAGGIPHTKLLRAGIAKTPLSRTVAAAAACRALAVTVDNKLVCIGKTIAKVKQNL